MNIKYLQESLLTFGWCVLPSLVDKPAEIAKSIMEETLECLFTEEDDLRAIENMKEDGIDPFLLLTQPDLREKYLDDPTSIWHNGNMRQPKLSRNTGMMNIYFNNMVRDKILFNENIYNTINLLYECLTGIKEDSIYLYGSDRVAIKAKGSTDMPYHIDCNIVYNGRPCFSENDVEFISAPTHPLTMFRIQSIVTLQIDSEEKFNGRTEILSGYNRYFLLGIKFFSRYFPLKKYKKGREFVPIILTDVFKQHLSSFLEYVKSFYFEDTEKLIPFAETSLKEEELHIYDSLPKERVEIEWLMPRVKEGDILCFDQRLPHRNTKNKSSISRVSTFISLYPKSYYNLDVDVPIYNLFEGKVEKSRDTYDNILERERYKDVWEKRVSFQLTPLIKRMLNIEEFGTRSNPPKNREMMRK
jgi:hypothetical protein